jgi:hypothetical protein
MSKVKFSSKFKSHRIVLKPARHRLALDGGKEYIPGLSAQFQNGVFETSDENTIAALRAHQDFGLDFFVVGEQSNPTSDEGVRALDEDQAGVINSVTSCPECTFNAKTNAGLQAHMRAAHSKK